MVIFLSQKAKEEKYNCRNLPLNLVLLEGHLALIYPWDQVDPVIKEVKKRMKNKIP